LSCLFNVRVNGETTSSSLADRAASRHRGDAGPVPQYDDVDVKRLAGQEGQEIAMTHGMFNDLKIALSCRIISFIIVITRTPGQQRSFVPISFASCGRVVPLLADSSLDVRVVFASQPAGGRISAILVDTSRRHPSSSSVL